jgi:hypothetical protein
VFPQPWLGGGGCGPPIGLGMGEEGDQVMLKAGGGGRIGKWMGAHWFWVSTQNNGCAPP